MDVWHLCAEFEACLKAVVVAVFDFYVDVRHITTVSKHFSVRYRLRICSTKMRYVRVSNALYSR